MGKYLSRTCLLVERLIEVVVLFTSPVIWGSLWNVVLVSHSLFLEGDGKRKILHKKKLFLLEFLVNAGGRGFPSNGRNNSSQKSGCSSSETGQEFFSVALVKDKETGRIRVRMWSC